MTVKDIAWFVGLIEGEGTFFFDKASVGIRLTMTDEDVIRHAAQLVGGPSVYSCGPYGKGKKRLHGFSLYGSRAAGWMMTLYPLLGQRRQARVRELLAIWKTQRNNRSHKLKGAPSPSSDAHENRAA